MVALTAPAVSAQVPIAVPVVLGTRLTVPVGAPETPEPATVIFTVAAEPGARLVGVTDSVVVEVPQLLAGVLNVPFDEYQPLIPTDGESR